MLLGFSTCDAIKGTSSKAQVKIGENNEGKFKEAMRHESEPVPVKIKTKKDGTTEVSFNMPRKTKTESSISNDVKKEDKMRNLTRWERFCRWLSRMSLRMGILLVVAFFVLPGGFITGIVTRGLRKFFNIRHAFRDLVSKVDLIKEEFNDENDKNRIKKILKTQTGQTEHEVRSHKAIKAKKNKY